VVPVFSMAQAQHIADIYAFVKSLPGPRSPKEFPILNN
jgi:hypothetical protein